MKTENNIIKTIYYEFYSTCLIYFSKSRCYFNCLLVTKCFCDIILVNNDAYILC